MQSSDRFKIGFGGDLAAQADFVQIWVRFWADLGAILGPKLGSCWGHVGKETNFWRPWRAFQNEW